MLKKEINDIELSVENPYEMQLVNIPAGSYRLKIIHQSKEVFERPKSLFFTFDIPGLSPQEIRDLLGLKDISTVNGVFAYAGGGLEKAGFYVQEVNITVKSLILNLRFTTRTFLLQTKIQLDTLGFYQEKTADSNVLPTSIPDLSLIGNYHKKIEDLELENKKLSEQLQKMTPISSERESLTWHKFDIGDFSEIKVNLSCSYNNIRNKIANNRKAILLIKLFDQEMQEINVIGLGLGLYFSKKYNCHFKYIENTEGVQRAIFQFARPKFAQYLVISYTSFGLVDNEYIEFDDLMIEYQIDKSNISNLISNPVVKNKYTPNNNIVISLLDSYGAKILDNLFLSYPLVAHPINQIKASQAFTFFIDSHWISKNGGWNYALVSRDFSNYQGENLKEAIFLMKKRKIPIVFYYKNNEKVFHLFNSIISMADYLITSNESLFSQLVQQEKKVFYIKGVINQFIYNLKDSVPFDKKDNKVLSFIDYKLPFFENNDFLESIPIDVKEQISFFKKKEVNVPNGLLDVHDLSKGENEEVYVNKFKNHKFYLNIADDSNSVPQQVLDSLACGTPVISTPSPFLEKHFSGVIKFINSPDEIKSIMSLYDERWSYLRLSHLGFRKVIREFNSYYLKDLIKKAVTGDSSNSNEDPLVSIVMATMREKYIDRIFENLRRQNYSNKEVIFVTQNFSKEGLESLKSKLNSLKGYKNIKILSNNSDITLGERLNLAASHGRGQFVAKMDDDDFYFDNYLSDMLLPFKFGDFDVVGKAENFVYLEELNKTVLLRKDRAANQEITFVAGPTLVIKKNSFDAIGGFLALNRGEDSTLIKRILEKGGKVYSSDPFNFIQFRSNNLTDHTWQQKIEAFESSGTLVADGFASDIARI